MAPLVSETDSELSSGFRRIQILEQSRRSPSPLPAPNMAWHPLEVHRLRLGRLQYAPAAWAHVRQGLGQVACCAHGLFVWLRMPRVSTGRRMSTHVLWLHCRSFNCRRGGQRSCASTLPEQVCESSGTLSLAAARESCFSVMRTMSTIHAAVTVVSGEDPSLLILSNRSA